jgi:hypothetical protein
LLTPLSVLVLTRRYSASTRSKLGLILLSVGWEGFAPSFMTRTLDQQVVENALL